MLCFYDGLAPIEFNDIKKNKILSNEENLREKSKILK